MTYGRELHSCKHPRVHGRGAETTLGLIGRRVQTDARRVGCWLESLGKERNSLSRWNKFPITDVCVARRVEEEEEEEDKLAARLICAY